MRSVCGALVWTAALAVSGAPAGEGASAISDGRLRVEFVGKGNMSQPSAAVSVRLRVSGRGNFLDGKAVVIPDRDLRALVEEVAAGRDEVLVVLDVAEPADTTVGTLSTAIDRLAAALPAKKKMTIVVRE